MLDWLMKTHQDTAKELKAVQMKALRLEGGLAALEAAIKQQRKLGGGSVAAPAAPTTVTMTPNGDVTINGGGPDDIKALRAIQGVTSAVKVPHGPVQADEELRE